MVGRQAFPIGKPACFQGRTVSFREDNTKLTQTNCEQPPPLLVFACMNIQSSSWNFLATFGFQNFGSTKICLIGPCLNTGSQWILKVLGWFPFIKMNESMIYPLSSQGFVSNPQLIDLPPDFLAAWSVLPKWAVSQIRTSRVNPRLETKVKHQGLDQWEIWAHLTKPTRC